MTRILLALVLAAATTAAAQPVVTGISPDNGPAAGGTVVTITGSGFAQTAQVRFGATYGRNATLVNENTLRVTAPANLPGRVPVIVEQSNGYSVLQAGFTFTGTIDEAFDRVLLPLFTEPVDGAFGSRFVTQLRLANTSATEEASVFGLTPYCFACVLPPPVVQPFTIEPGASLTPGAYEYTGIPGAFLFIPKSSPRVEANLRVYDETRDALNFGTEMPVVYDHALTVEPFKLLGVPFDPRFRTMLRIYATGETTVTVAFDDVAQVVPLPRRPGSDLYDPAYAQLGIAGGSGTVDITITPSPFAPSVPGHEPARVWAFVSVTNNETQLITTITPQR